MKKLNFSLILIIACLVNQAQEVSITGNKFTVDGNEIWFNGINTPWHLFDDFGRSDFNPQWWDDEFARYQTNHINLARVWIHGSGEVSPDIDASGHVSGANAAFWDHMDHLMDVSRSYGVYVMPALLSFDITKNTYPTSARWRAWLQSPANIQSYIDNVLIPLVQRYEDEPYLLAWEICNEPEWMFENTEHGPQSFEDVQRMHAMLAAAVHENSSKPVTTGSAAPKWNSPIYDEWGDYEGNMFSDEALSARIGDPDAFLDFYQYHWYPWQSEWMNSPFTQTTLEYDIDDRPVIVGESEGNNVCDAYVCQTVSEMYESAYLNGFDGVCAWKTPQNDGHGTFENIAVATNNFYGNHPALVYPEGSGPIPVTGVSISLTTLDIETGNTHQLSATVSPSDALDKRVSWTSTNPAVASVSNAGLVTGITAGSVTITVTTSDGGFTAGCAVTVTPGDGNGGDCTNPSPIALPYNQTGTGEYCWVTSGNISFVNSWNMDVVEINGVDFTNAWSNNMPAKIDGNYFIYYKASYGWANLDINGSGGDGDPDPTFYQLTTNVIGLGAVSPSSGSYLENSSVTLTATAAQGYTFSGWSGAASGSNPQVSVLMNTNKSVTATFIEDPVDPQIFTVTVYHNYEGSISIDEITANEGSTISISVIETADFNFDNWSGDASGTSNPLSITVLSDMEITANYSAVTTDPEYTLTIQITGQGSVTMNPPGGSYTEGTSITLTAVASQGWTFAGWNTSPDNILTLIMPSSDLSVVASFTQDPVGDCDSYTTISIPFVQNGAGDYCWVTTTEMAYINSWNLAELSINGIDFTNTWANNLPPAIDGQWFITYKGPYGWSHFEAPQAKSTENEVTGTEIRVFPNPFTSELNIDLSGFSEVSKLELINTLGETIYVSDEPAAALIRIEPDRPRGTYILRISTSGKVYTRSILKL
jgi:uncharacterized repeat protein (TIGR02543 family)